MIAGLIILAAGLGTLGVQDQAAARFAATYIELEEKLAEGKFNFVRNDVEGVECIAMTPTGDPELDETFCKSVHACGVPNVEDTDHTRFWNCMNLEQRKQLAVLAIRRAGLALSEGSAAH